MAFDVFISYASQDKLVANAACARLEAVGIRCWIAPRDITAGVGYGEAIMDAIGRCKVMLLIFSSSANQSTMISREIERAVSKGLPVLPMRIEDVMPSGSLEFFIGSVHWLDALTAPLDQHFTRLADTIKVLLSVGNLKPTPIAEPIAMPPPTQATTPVEAKPCVLPPPTVSTPVWDVVAPRPGPATHEVHPTSTPKRARAGRTLLQILLAIIVGVVSLGALSLCNPRGVAPTSDILEVPAKEEQLTALEAYNKGEDAFQAKNYDEALRWFRQGAGLGGTRSMLRLANIYSRGLGVPKDIGEVARWERAAADAGDASGQFLTGRLYRNGLGVPRDYAMAMTWYRKAADQGDVNADNEIGDLYMDGLGVGQDYTRAREWYQKAADRGQADSQHQLAWIYQNGLGVGRDYAKAMEWYRKAADQGVAGSQWQIGFLYENGIGVPKNHTLALEWIKKAAANGFKNATDWLASHPQ